MKNIEWGGNFLVKLIILILFILFSFHKMEISILFITVELLLFSFINSFIIENKKIRFDIEIFSFQGMSIFLLERLAIFYWNGIPEIVYKDYVYVKLLFVITFFIIFVLLNIKNSSKYLKIYFYITLFYLVVIANVFQTNFLFKFFYIFGDEFFRLLPFAFFIYDGWIANFGIDIILTGVFSLFLTSKSRKYLFVCISLILYIFLRYMIIYLGGQMI